MKTVEVNKYASYDELIMALNVCVNSLQASFEEIKKIAETMNYLS